MVVEWEVPTNVTNMVDLVTESQRILGWDAISLMLIVAVGFVTFIVTSSRSNDSATPFMMSSYAIAVTTTFLWLGGMLDTQYASLSWIVMGIAIAILHWSNSR